ncbi:MAG: hypothetical protein M0Z69_04810 [Actinomycetota bacterium]|nr:hypothetical protein [Actinomycetota bacterium]
MTPRCLYCGRRPVEQHHVTGRLCPSGRYLDPRLSVPLCKRHHAREHEVLRRRGLAFPDGADLTGHRLARLLDFLGRLGDHRRPLVLDGPALGGLCTLLLDATAGEREEVPA